MRPSTCPRSSEANMEVTDNGTARCLRCSLIRCIISARVAHCRPVWSPIGSTRIHSIGRANPLTFFGGAFSYKEKFDQLLRCVGCRSLVYWWFIRAAAQLEQVAAMKIFQKVISRLKSLQLGSHPKCEDLLTPRLMLIVRVRHPFTWIIRQSWFSMFTSWLLLLQVSVQHHPAARPFKRWTICAEIWTRATYPRALSSSPSTASHIHCE